MANLSSASNFGISSPDNYFLGRGIIYFDLYNESTNTPTDRFRDLGNATEFNLSIDEEELEHQSSQEGLKTTDASVSLSKELGGSFTLDEITEENLSMFLSGNVDESVTQLGADVSGGIVAALGPYVTTNTQGKSGLLAGNWLELYDLDVPTQTRTRLYNLNAISFTVGGASVSAQEGVDYYFDGEMGLLYPIQGGVLDSGNDILQATVTGENIDTTFKEVRTFDRSVIRGALLFRSQNAQNGEIREVRLHKCKITAEGDLSLIGDDWANVQFNFTAENDSVNHPDTPTGYIRSFSPSFGS